jgi:hypothetical protein
MINLGIVRIFNFVYLFIILFIIEIFSIFTFLLIFKKKPLFLISNFQQIMNSCDFKEIIVSEVFEFENGMLGLDRDCYLSIIKFLDSSILKKV